MWNDSASLFCILYLVKFRIIFLPFSIFCPEVDNDVISGMAVNYVGMDVYVKLGDCRSNGSQDIQEADFVSEEHD